MKPLPEMEQMLAPCSWTPKLPQLRAKIKLYSLYITHAKYSFIATQNELRQIKRHTWEEWIKRPDPMICSLQRLTLGTKTETG